MREKWKLENSVMHKVSFGRHGIDFSCINSITGIIQQLGETGVAMSTLVSALTSYLINLSKKARPLIS